MFRRYFDIFAMIIILLIVSFIYSGTLHFPFHYDDKHSIEENRYLQIQVLNKSSLIKVLQSKVARTRPLTNISFALNYLPSKLDTYGYHLVNILIHLISSLLVYFLLSFIFLSGGFLDNLRAKAGAFAGALFWAVNPVQTQAVTYISQRATSLSAMFFLLAFVLYLYQRRKGKGFICYIFAAISWVLACASKEIAFTLPAVILIYEALYYNGFKKEEYKKLFLFFISGTVLTGIIYFFFYGAQNPLRLVSIIWDKNILDETHSGYQHILTGFRVVIYYISLLFFPYPGRLKLLYDMQPSKSLIDPVTTILSILAVTGLIVWAVLSEKKNKIISFGIWWFLLNLLLETFLIKLHLIFEHRLYLPSIGLVIIAGYYFAMFKERLWKYLALCLIIVIFSVWTYQRNEVWSSPAGLMKDAVEKSPRSSVAHNNLGFIYFSQGRITDAEMEFKSSLRVDPLSWMAFNNLGNIYLKLNKLEDAEKSFLFALKTRPEFLEPILNLGIVYKLKGNIKDAEERFREIIKKDFNLDYPETTQKAFFNLGLLLAEKGKFHEALNCFDNSLAIVPNDTQAYYHKGMIYISLRNFTNAEEEFKKSKLIDPSYYPARVKLGWIYIFLNNPQKASSEFYEVLTMQPNHSEAKKGLEIAKMKSEA